MLEIADAVVIGGGILGASLTAALGRRLSRVLLIDADRCGARATAGGFAWVNASSKWRDEAYHRLNAHACAAHLALATVFEASRTGWNGGGSLFCARRADPASVADLEARLAALQSWDFPIARLTAPEMRALEPAAHFEEDAIGLFAPSEGWVSAAHLMRLYAEQAREHHAETAEYTQAFGFSLDHRGGIASVETNRGRVSAKIAVIAAGAGSGALVSRLMGERAAGIVGTSPGLLAEIGPLPPAARIHRVCYPHDAGGLHIRPTAEGGMLLGADDTDALYSHADAGAAQGGPAAERAGAETLMRRAAALLPQLDLGATVTTRWCMRPVPADGLPVVGELPGVTGAYLLASHSGVTLAPLLGRLLADEILTGRKSPLLEPYRPARLLG